MLNRDEDILKAAEDCQKAATASRSPRGRDLGLSATAAGSNLVINDDGTCSGSVSAACGRRSSGHRSAGRDRQRRSRRCSNFGVADETAWNVGLSCGGTIAYSSRRSPDREASDASELNAERAARRPVIVVTDTANGEQRLGQGQGLPADPLRAELSKQLRMGKSGMVEPAARSCFSTSMRRPQGFVIVGAVHISQALAPLARSLDYDVTVVDPRTAFASPERFPMWPLIAEWPDVALPPLNIDHYTAFVALTHDPKIDDPALLHAFECDCFYIGALARERPTQARRAAEGARRKGQRHHPHPRPIGLSICARLALGDRGGHHGRDHRAVAVAKKKKPRHEIRSCQSGGRDRGVTVHTLRQGPLVLKKGTTVARPKSMR